LGRKSMINWWKVRSYGRNRLNLKPINSNRKTGYQVSIHSTMS
jgi:hypothetical protein